MSERLRGINFGGWFSQVDAIKEKDPDAFMSIDAHMETFIAKDDFAQVKQWGFNHVRLPLDSYLFFAENEKPLSERLKFLDNAVKWADGAGLRLILDLHECPGHDFADIKEPVQNLFKDPAYIKKAQRIWSCLSERYSADKHVIFEALNEPVAPNAQIWNEIKTQLCKAIRSHAPNSPIIVGSNMWSWPSTYNELTPVDMDSIYYCFHFYEPLLFTHQYAPWMNEPEIRVRRKYPDDYGKGFTRKYGLVLSDGRWDRDRFVKELQLVATFRDKYKVPIICNEFGVYAPVPLEYQIQWLSDLLSVLQEMNIGFSCWNYKNLDFGIISKGEKLHEILPQYDNSERINFDVLSVLQKY
jgi:aryl-phospho-beta-D-glucosidase BglC (GH1 family)